MRMGTEKSLEQRTGILYGDVTFEPRADYYGEDKRLYTFDKSLERVRAAGHVRHPRPSEVFSLLIANLEDELTSEQESVAEDMLKSYGEWLSAAVETKTEGKIFSREKRSLSVYFDPLLEWDGKKYVWKNGTPTYAKKQEFDVTGRAAETWIDLGGFPDDFVLCMYGSQFKDLPPVMQQGDKRAQVYLPPDGQIWPVCRGNFSNRFNVYSYNYDYYCNYYGASRGVVPSAREK